MGRLVVDQIEGRSGNANTITIPTGHNLYAPGGIVQVVQTVFADTWSAGGSGTTWYTVTNLDTTITPKSASSKILIKTSLTIGSGYWEIQGRYLRDSTAIGLGNVRGSRSQCTFLDNRYEAAGSVRYGWGTVSAEYLDSPNTTSATTYKVQLNGYSTFTIGVNYNPYHDPDSSDYYGTPISTMTLMEIAQ